MALDNNKTLRAEEAAKRNARPAPLPYEVRTASYPYEATLIRYTDTGTINEQKTYRTENLEDAKTRAKKWMKDAKACHADQWEAVENREGDLMRAKMKDKWGTRYEVALYECKIKRTTKSKKNGN